MPLSSPSSKSLEQQTTTRGFLEASTIVQTHFEPPNRQMQEVKMLN